MGLKCQVAEKMFDEFQIHNVDNQFHKSKLLFPCHVVKQYYYH